MRRIDGVRKAQQKWQAVLAMLVIAIARAAAKEQPEAKPAKAEAHTRQIVVSIPDRKLALLQDGEVIRTYPVAVGAAVSESPSGEFKVVSRLSNPTYYHPHKVIPPGKANPLGTRWIGLDKKGYGIHGTNQPDSIGKAASHGCVRMRRADLEALFSMVRVGDSVVIRADRDELITRVFAADANANVVASASASDSAAVVGGEN